MPEPLSSTFCRKQEVMGKIRDKFNELKKQGKKAFIPYLTFGFPDIKTWESLMLTLDSAGADFIEVGIPFSDPIADGPIIQHSSNIALEKGANTQNLFESLKKVKPKIKAPLIIMSYTNPVYSMGVKRFFRQASGLIEGVIISDMLVEESGEFVDTAWRYNVDTIFFISPTTRKNRINLIDRRSSGFVYFISVTGVTGPRKDLSKGIGTKLSSIRKKIKNPLCLGFGISSRKSARKIKEKCDGIIVGSAIIKKINELRKNKNFLRKIESYILWLNG